VNRLLALPDNVVFYWVDNATPAQVVARARALGVRALAVKAGDSGQLWPQYQRLAGPLGEAGVARPAWAYVRPETLAGDVAVAVAAQDAGAECFIADMETPYLNEPEAARRFGAALRARLGPEYPLLVTTFSGPDAFPSFPWREVAAWADALVPQWYDAAYPGLARLGRPILPAGPLYGTATADDVAALRAFARLHRIPTLFWWRWGSCPDDLLRQAVAPAADDKATNDKAANDKAPDNKTPDDKARGDRADSEGAHGEGAHGDPPPRALGASRPARAATVRRVVPTASRQDVGAGDRPRAAPQRRPPHTASGRAAAVCNPTRTGAGPVRRAHAPRLRRTGPPRPDAPSPPPSTPTPTRGGLP